MSVLTEWVNDYYLQDDTVDNIREAFIAKPDLKYVVLDNFFKIDKFDQLIEHHQGLEFDEAADRRSHTPGKLLPYDGAVVWAQAGEHFGSDLFFDQEWHEYCAFIACAKLKIPTTTEVKLRWHKPHADGFWIHTDSGIRQIVMLIYFNKQWKASDGGLFQLWRVDESTAPDVFYVDNPEGRLDILNQHARIRTATPGGGFADSNPHDLVLVDQVVPVYNRMVVCNFQNNPTYHSITPSNGRARTAVVQWLGIDNTKYKDMLCYHPVNSAPMQSYDKSSFR